MNTAATPLVINDENDAIEVSAGIINDSLCRRMC